MTSNPVKVGRFFVRRGETGRYGAFDDEGVRVIDEVPGFDGHGFATEDEAIRYAEAVEARRRGKA